jgi:hypothetical protein
MVAGPTFSRAIQRGRSIQFGYRRDGWVRRQICCRAVRRARRDTHMRNVRVPSAVSRAVRTCRRGRRFATAQRRTRLVAGGAYKAPSMTSAATRKTAPSALGANARRSHERRFAHTVTAKYGQISACRTKLYVSDRPTRRRHRSSWPSATLKEPEVTTSVDISALPPASRVDRSEGRQLLRSGNKR